MLLGTLEERIRINKYALCELQDRRENVRQELETFESYVRRVIEILLLDEQDMGNEY